MKAQTSLPPTLTAMLANRSALAGRVHSLVVPDLDVLPPTYEAFSLLRVEPSNFSLLPSDNERNTTARIPYLQTQVQLIKSDRVLDMAVANPMVSNLPSIKQSDDPIDYLRKDLTVENVQDAYLIRVGLESKIPSEAATIVNAVVDAYKHHTEAYAQSANRRLRESLEREERSLQKKIDATQNELKVLVQNGRMAAPAAGEVLDRNDHPAHLRSRTSVISISKVSLRR